MERDIITSIGWYLTHLTPHGQKPTELPKYQNTQNKIILQPKQSGTIDINTSRLKHSATSAGNEITSVCP